MKHIFPKKMKQERMVLANWLIERRLKLNERTHKTLVSISVSDTFIVPTCVTNAVSPFGRLTKVLRVSIIEVKHDMEWTIWSIVPVSITQSVYLNIFLSTILAEKIECSKVGKKGILGLVPDIRAELKLRLVYAKVPTTLEVKPKAPSPPVAMQEALTLAS